MSSDSSYKKLMAHLEYPNSDRLRAILENLMTPEQADMAAALPGTPEDVSEKTGYAAGLVREELDSLFFKGVVIPKGDFNNREYYRFVRSVGQFHDATQATKQRDVDEDVEFYTLWHDFVMNEWYPDVGKRQAAIPAPHSRIIPSYKAIKDLPDILPSEDFREILKAQGTIAVVPCSCRYRTTAVAEQCEHFEEEEVWSCLQFGRSADYVIARDSGKELSIDEALELLDKIEEGALLHIWPNSTKMTGVGTSCHCCRDCCMTWVPMDIVGESIGKVWEKARFEAVIDQEKCEGCQKCIERCHFEAIELIEPEVKKKRKKKEKMKSRVIADKCWGCGVCVVGCVENFAVSMITVRPPEHIPAGA